MTKGTRCEVAAKLSLAGYAGTRSAGMRGVLVGPAKKVKKRQDPQAIPSVGLRSLPAHQALCDSPSVRFGYGFARPTWGN